MGQDGSQAIETGGAEKGRLRTQRNTRKGRVIMAGLPPSTPSHGANAIMQQASQSIMNSPNPRVRNQEKARLAKKDLAYSETPKGTRYIAPTARPLPIPAVLSTVPDPEDPIQLQSQLEMLKIFQHEGRVGLQEEVYRIARTQKAMALKESENLGRDVSWDPLLDDEKSGKNTVFHLLMTVPDDFIQSMIKNTLAHDALWDRSVRDFVKKRLAWHGPAIYANITALGGILFSGKIPEVHQGRWLNKTQIEKLLVEIEKYIEDRPGDRANNIAIDNKWSKERFDKKRRYCSNAKMKAKFKVWMKTIRKQYCDGLDPTKNDVPFMRTPMEIGWAIDVYQRLQQHARNGSTTNIYGLVNVLTYERFKFPRPAQFPIFPIGQPTGNMPQIGELTATVLCNSYWFNGGLNHHHAGIFPDQSIAAKKEAGWESSAQRAIWQYEKLQSTDLLRVKTRQIQGELIARKEDKKEEHAKLQGELKAARDKLTELELKKAERRAQEAQKIKEENEPLWGKLQDTAMQNSQQKEASDVLREQHKMPWLREDVHMTDTVEERLSRCRDIVGEWIPSRSIATLAGPEDIDWEDDNSLGEDIVQVDDEEDPGETVHDDDESGADEPTEHTSN
ncbi:MAG: hypothetical protein Q9181_004991 [Wetmoreana brouardii]